MADEKTAQQIATKSQKLDMKRDRERAELHKTKYDLTVSTYVEPEDTRPKIDIVKLNQEIVEIVTEKERIRKEIDFLLGQIDLSKIKISAYRHDDEKADVTADVTDGTTDATDDAVTDVAPDTNDGTDDGTSADGEPHDKRFVADIGEVRRALDSISDWDPESQADDDGNQLRLI